MYRCPRARHPSSCAEGAGLHRVLPGLTPPPPDAASWEALTRRHPRHPAAIPAVVQLKRAAFEAHTSSTPVLPAQRPRVDSVIPIADADLGAADPAAPSAITSPPNGVSVDAVYPPRPRSGASSSAPVWSPARPQACGRPSTPPPVSPHQSSSSLKQGEPTEPRPCVVK